jgi:hypothetical protein
MTLFLTPQTTHFIKLLTLPLKMEAARSCEIVLHSQNTTQHNNPKTTIYLYLQHHGNLKYSSDSELVISSASRQHIT